MNYRKIVQKNKLCHSKQQLIVYLITYLIVYLIVYLFNDICYLVIGCFDRKIVVFQQTVVKGLLYP